MADVKVRVATTPPSGGLSAGIDEPEDRGAGARLVIMHSPEGKGKGSLIEVPQRGFAIGGSHDDLAVGGADQSTRLQIDRVVLDAVKPRVEWRATGRGRVQINDESADQKILRAGDRLRVVDTFFRFLCGQDMEEQFHEAIYFLTISDEPTGLHNGRYLEEALGKELGRAEKAGTRVSVAVLAFQGADAVQASSHDVLREPVERIRRCIPRGRVAARSGDLEVVIVSTDVSPEHVREELAECLLVPTESPRARIYCGVAESSTGVSAQSLIAEGRNNARLLSG
jgi:GGDEF domain-containing protein